MPLAYQGVQAGHAVAQWLLDNRDTQKWNNDTLVYLQAENLEDWSKLLRMNYYKISEFYEPDIGNEMTAIAVYDTGEIFRGLRLMGR